MGNFGSRGGLYKSVPLKRDPDNWMDAPGEPSLGMARVWLGEYEKQMNAGQNSPLDTLLFAWSNYQVAEKFGGKDEQMKAKLHQYIKESNLGIVTK